MNKLIAILQSIENENKKEKIILHFPYITQEINFLLLQIKFSINWQDAIHYFDMLEKIQPAVATIQHKLGIDLSNSLKLFVKDFDLLHSITERERLFAEIKRSEFFYSPDYDKIILKYQNEIIKAAPTGDLDSQIRFLHDQLVRLIAKIKSCDTFEDANQFFDLLENLHHCMAILLFKYDISLGQSMNDFVRIFDRIDDLSERERLYTEIKKDAYKAS